MVHLPAIEDLLHCTMMNIAAAIDVDADHRWKEKVVYEGRIVQHEKPTDRSLWLTSHLQRACQIA